MYICCVYKCIKLYLYHSGGTSRGITTYVQYTTVGFFDLEVIPQWSVHSFVMVENVLIKKLEMTISKT